MTARRFALVLCAGTLVALLSGCARLEPSRIAPGEPPPGVRSLFVTGHRYHSGIAVRARDVPSSAWPARADFPGADYLDVGWGARDFYPVDDPGIGVALRVLFSRSPGTINVAPIQGSLASAFPESEIIELRVSEAAFARAVEFVRASHAFDAGGAPIAVEAGARQSGRFYASSRTFHLFENCNVWVARVLESAGLAVDPGSAFTAGLLLAQVRALSEAVPAPRTARTEGPFMLRQAQHERIVFRRSP